MNKIYNSILLLLFLIFANHILAQNEINSPYSGFGIGKLSNASSISNMSMGGIAFAVQNPYFVNFANPASYVAFDSLSFLADASFSAVFNTLKTNTLSQKSSYVRPNYLAIGLPVTPHWRTSAGILPYSDLGYTIINSTTVDSIGKINYTFKGEGGLMQLYWGNAFRLYKGLSIGLNVSYMFGNLATNRIAEFDNPQTFNSVINNSINIDGAYISAGIQYFFDVKEKNRVGIGLTYENSAYLWAKKSELVTIFQGNYENMTGQDIVSNIQGERGRMIIPQSLGGGFSYQYSNRLLVGADFSWHNWENYSLMSESDSLQNSWEMKIGIQYVPNAISSNLLKRIHLRGGAKYATNYIAIDGKSVNELVFAVGIGIPLKGSTSNHIINLLFEYGQSGNLKQNPIAENFIRLSFNFILHERWYQRVKIE